MTDTLGAVMGFFRDIIISAPIYDYLYWNFVVIVCFSVIKVARKGETSG